jgi:hypothetical protein
MKELLEIRNIINLVFDFESLYERLDKWLLLVDYQNLLLLLLVMTLELK